MLALSQELIEQLSSYDWPGNIRELRNVIERAMILSSDDMISKGSPIKQTSNPPTDSFLTLAENEKQHILAALKLCKGIIGGPKGAARLLDVNQNTLRSRMAKLDIRKPDESAQ
jgi:transcriptional regulator of acetoin/glycerol metabolism